MSNHSSKRPLDGIRILDLSRLLPGGFSTLILAELGAEVVKVEDVEGGDGIRFMFGMGVDGESGAHVVLNRGKKSVSVNLKDSQGQDAIRALIATSDVMVDSFRPGVLKRLGLSADELQKANPDLVHISITAFGKDGSLSHQPTHDLNAQGFGGALGLSVGNDGTPPMPGVQMADISSGFQAAIAILSGLRIAEKAKASKSPIESRGYRTHVNMTDSAMSMVPLAAAVVASTGAAPQPPDIFTGELACYGLYRCSDGEWITVGGLEPKFFMNMLNIMDRQSLSPLQYAMDKQGELRIELEREFASKSRDEWVELLGLEQTCVGPVYSIAEALASRARESISSVRTIEFRDGRPFDAPSAVHWVHAKASKRSRQAPLLGEDTVELLEAAGIPADRIESLISDGIVRATP